MSDSIQRVLFLDRDGVINKRLIDDYVTMVEEFEFLPGVLEAIRELNHLFNRIFIVTNQQGIAKGLMTEADLSEIHLKMLQQIAANGGKVDAVFYCPHMRTEGCDCRKPKIGMYQQALSSFPDIKNNVLYMVGDTSSDMLFAKNIGAVAVMINDVSANDEGNYKFVFSSLEQFAKDIHLVLT
jgi:D-glycero-D-manno-heptose 1,7-bisphosphate phosphatase